MDGGRQLGANCKDPYRRFESARRLQTSHSERCCSEAWQLRVASSFLAVSGHAGFQPLWLDPALLESPNEPCPGFWTDGLDPWHGWPKSRL